MTFNILLLLVAVLAFGVGLVLGGVAGRGAEVAHRARLLHRGGEASRSAGELAPPIEDPSVRARSLCRQRVALGSISEGSHLRLLGGEGGDR